MIALKAKAKKNGQKSEPSEDRKRKPINQSTYLKVCAKTKDPNPPNLTNRD